MIRTVVVYRTATLPPAGYYVVRGPRAGDENENQNPACVVCHKYRERRLLRK